MSNKPTRAELLATEAERKVRFKESQKKYDIASKSSLKTFRVSNADNKYIKGLAKRKHFTAQQTIAHLVQCEKLLAKQLREDEDAE